MENISRKIVVAIDGSKPSQNAIRYSVDLAKNLGAQVIVLHTIQSAQKIGYWVFIDRHFDKELHQYAEKICKEAKEIAMELGHQVQIETREGVPYEEIIKFIKEHPDTILLVMGTYGHSLTEKRLIGSTTDRVIREISKEGISVPVTLVPFVQE